MSSFFSLFCCCGHDGDSAKADDQIDEHSRLIPSNIDATPSPSVEYTDHQRMQERLVTIVRAKERKMVNLTSQIPFNLHNRIITPKSSLSRSVSLSTGRPEPFHPTYDVREPLTVELRSEALPTDKPRNVSDSHSREVSIARDPEQPREPVFNVRLVKPEPTVPQRIGRPRHRAFGSPTPSTRNAETFSDASSAQVPSPSDIQPLDEICWNWGDPTPSPEN
ncbi:hypothetical protein MIND_01096800 [Mycena indigotica]|uniref:Uncharacterized protein n=1 Tax=Mycena indigotica TaxID=2126181 RepID=A0A8H6SAX5_9AGAR|nr:uncharacterized protein MIND_01096800 [Mycena indigotica]KAF7295568.1 hypothetical protein MIND_01096800 [Mycena indigotica]